MRKKKNYTPLTKEYIELFKSQEKTWKDLGFNDYLIRESVAKDLQSIPNRETNLETRETDDKNNELKNNKLGQVRPALFPKTPRYFKHRKLEQIFLNANFEFYINIALKIGCIKKRSSYNRTTKTAVLEIKDTFNKYSIPRWGLKLIANMEKTQEGLKLVPSE